MRRAANRLVSAPTLFLTNPQSITNVFEEFLERVLLHKPDIIGVSETWFSINKPAEDYTLDGYQQLTKDRLARAGGVVLYVRITCALGNAISTCHQTSNGCGPKLFAILHIMSKHSLFVHDFIHQRHHIANN